MTGSCGRAARSRPPGAQAAPDATLMTLLYTVLPVLIIAAVVRLLLAERLDFSAVLLGITVITGIVWGLDSLLLRPRARGGGARRRARPGAARRARHGRLRAQLLPGGARGAGAALLHLRALPHPLRLDDADAARRRLHHRQQVRLRAAPAGHQQEGRRHRRAAARRRGGVPLPAATRPSTSSSAWWACRGITSRCATTTSTSTASRCPTVIATQHFNDGCYVNFTLAHEHLGAHEHFAMYCPVAIDRQPVAAGLQPPRRARLRVRGRGRPRGHADSAV